MERRGASNVYHLDPHGLAQMRCWLDGMWAGALESFKAEVEKGGKEGT
jgi:hypothetical protein